MLHGLPVRAPQLAHGSLSRSGALWLAQGGCSKTSPRHTAPHIPCAGSLLHAGIATRVAPATPVQLLVRPEATGWRLGLQAVTSRRNKDMSPALAKRKRQAMARTTESLLFLLNSANTSAALLVPCVVITKTAAEPLPAASLTFLVSRTVHAGATRPRFHACSPPAALPQGAL